MLSMYKATARLVTVDGELNSMSIRERPGKMMELPIGAAAAAAATTQVMSHFVLRAYCLGCSTSATTAKWASSPVRWLLGTSARLTSSLAIEAAIGLSRIGASPPAGVVTGYVPSVVGKGAVIVSNPGRSRIWAGGVEFILFAECCSCKPMLNRRYRCPGALQLV